MGAKRRTSRVRVKRAYEDPAPGDGHRVLVDRVWPRGLARSALDIVEWIPESGPSSALRKWFGHDPARWVEFRRRYRRELKDSEAVARLKAWKRRGPLTLVYGARDEQHNQAVVLAELLNA